MRGLWSVLAVLVTAGTAMGQSAREPATLSADRLLSIRSLLAGEAPQWAPDGSAVMFASSLGGSSGLWSVTPAGGFPRLIVDRIGGTGFLMSQMPRYSSDGQWIAYVSDRSGAQELWVHSLADGRDVQLTTLGARIHSYNWSPDGHSIAFADDRYGSYDIWKVSVPGGEMQALAQDRLFEVSPTWTPDGTHILYVRLDDHWVDHDIMEIPALGGVPRVVASDRNMFDYGAGTKFGYPLISPDGRNVLFVSDRNGWLNYWMASLSGGEPRALVAEEAEQGDARWSPDGKSVAYLSNHNGTIDLRIVAPGGAPRVLVAPKLGVVGNIEWSPDGTRISYRLATPTQPADLYVVNVRDGATRQLTSSMPLGGAAATLVTPEKITYTSFDGLPISGYLYKPADLRPGEHVPGIMFIHGGPTGMFNDAMQPEVQFWVRQGYVVLMPNIRGSSGYGRKFEDLNNKDWGGTDLKDVVAGGEYLKKLPYVNAQKLGITGTSYGGCMTMMAIAFAPGFFQAAIPASGYGDWVAFYHDQELRHRKLLDYELGGPPDQVPEIYRKISPSLKIADIRTPTFLVYGKGKFPGSAASENFAAEMENTYKVFRIKAYPGENYYVRSRENTRQLWLDMADFFNQFLKDRVVTPSTATAAAAGSGSN
jgi:dipeptidyl aminopeptidase/acylaminoacyl peptidase